MSITSIEFVLFAFATLILYFVVPKNFQWVTLLVASCYFYLIVCGKKGFLFVLFTAITIYWATIWLQYITDSQKAFLKDHKDSITAEEKRILKAKNAKKRKRILILTLILNFGIMVLCKYSHFAVATVNSLFSLDINNTFSIIAPLGLSFYTFQSTGYLVNIYWNNYRPEKNFFKVLLFVSFFPQITQGPISEFEQLSADLFSQHNFEYRNYAYGCQRMIWGFLKKMVIANTLSSWVQDVFFNYLEYTGIAVLIGAFFYSIQIYADFSGYMDIMCGYSEMLGIRLTENFDRPYFSKSIAEYWRRWHISLGAWFKQYIYYPIAVSKWNRNLSQKLTLKFGKIVGVNLPATIALIAVWLTTGLWHGASWGYIAWGGVNGLIIIVSMWMEPLYDKMKAVFHIQKKAFLWRCFQVVRTFILVTLIKVLPEVGTLSDGLGLWKKIFTDLSIPTSFSEMLPFVDEIYNLIIVTGLIFLMLILSLLQRKKPIREYFNSIPYILRIVVMAVCFLMIIIFGVRVSVDGGFMYAQF